MTRLHDSKAQMHIGNMKFTHPFNSPAYLLLSVLILSGCAATKEQAIDVKTIPNAQQVEKTTTRLIDTFNNFLDRNAIRNGAIAISYKGKLVGQSGKNRTAADPARLASLSKGITAVCTIHALENTNFNVNTPLQILIPDKLNSVANGLHQFGPITINQLITHTSGIRTKHLSLQGRFIRRYNREQKSWQLNNIMKYKPASGHGRNYFYSNANYLILGLVIERLTQTGYEEYCSNTIFSPLGISAAKLTPRWRILSAYAGWELSPIDHLRFINRYFTNNWISAFYKLRDFKTVSNESAQYGLGAWMREHRNGMRFWHNGTITWNSTQQNARFASFFAVYENGFSVSLNYAKDARDGRGREIEKALYKAIATDTH